MDLLRQLFRLVFIAIAMLALVLPASAADNVVNAAFKSPSIDLIPVLKLVKSGSPKAVIELPSAADGSKRLMTLQARQQDAKEYNWVVFSLKNVELRPQDLVLAVPYKGFVGSGIIWPETEGSRIRGLQVSEALKAVRLEVAGLDAIALSVAPGASLTYAIELPDEKIDEVRLWRRAAFDDKARQHAFFRGIVLGITLLIAIGISCLFIIKPQAVFPAAALFAWGAIAFNLMNSFAMPAALTGLADFIGRAGLRAIVEAMMLAGISATFLTYLELRHRSLLLYGILLSIVFGSLALAGAAFYVPLQAQGIARLLFAGTVVFGTVITIYYWSVGSVRGQTGLLPSLVLSAWVAIAAISCIGLLQSSFLLPVTTIGLVLALVTLALAVLPVAFGNALGSAYFLQDSGRRALALAGSELSVWDWDVESNRLYVGPELERALGMPVGSIADSGADDWSELVHPADKSAYFAAVEAAARRGRGKFGQKFRLRRSDGTYRWYQLRARAILGGDGAMRLIGTLCDITGQKRAEDNILVDAVYDRVTGLPNKALFLDRLNGSLQRLQEGTGGRLYVIVVDLDHYRPVSDGLGHEFGDSLLSVTARRIAVYLSPVDTLARLPGGQFAILLENPGTTQEIGAFCEQLRDAVAQPVNLRPQEVASNPSFGVAMASDPRQLASELLKDAEVAVYEAKRRGRHLIQFFTPDMRADPAGRTIRKTELEGAVERGEIVVYFQPIQRLSDGLLAGFEALARWNHPVDGLRGPASFIPIAEQTGLIKQIGSHVLHEAVRQLGIWQRAFRPNDPLFVAVNVSSEQLLDFSLVNDIKALLSREGIPPETLKLELTETLAMQNIELSMQVLQQLKELGIGLACDDFGTGYSALSNLRRLPFDTLKLDREFLDTDADAEKSEVILESLILMAHDLDLNVVVEGVENADQLEQLKKFECDFGQGFFIGGPVAPQRVIEVLGSTPYSQQADGRQVAATWELLRSAAQSDAVLTPNGAVPAPVTTTPPEPTGRQMQLDLEPEPPPNLAELSGLVADAENDESASIWPEDDRIVELPPAEEPLPGAEVTAEPQSTPEPPEPVVEPAVTEAVTEVVEDVPPPEEPAPAPEAQVEPQPEARQKDEPEVVSDSDVAPEPETEDKGTTAEQEKPVEAKDPEPVAEEDKEPQTAEPDSEQEASRTDEAPEAPEPEPDTTKEPEDTAAKAAGSPAMKKPVKTARPAAKKTSSRTRARKGPLAKKLRRAAKTRAHKKKV